MSKIIVTGGDGQLATCLKDVSVAVAEHNFVFKNSIELDVNNRQQIDDSFNVGQFDFCVNCAGYTAVDKAESEPKKAKKGNTNGAKNIAEACAKYNVILIHISTDFVFDGGAKIPYEEHDTTNPCSVYGRTKLDGELAIKKVLKQYFIIRTSWLFSEYGTNFMKTMLRLGDEKKQVRVVNDQMGAPTYAMDLANTIVKIISKNTDKYGVYHYCNEGSATWFEFAAEIFRNRGIENLLTPITTKEYVTLATRPAYSVLNTDNITKTFTLSIPHWKESLARCFEKIDELQD